MKTNYRQSKEEIELNYYKGVYQTTISKELDESEMVKIVRELLDRQKEDGSWSIIDDYKVDSDIRVAYIYLPTYYATATLMRMDLTLEFENNSNEKNALLNGLEFSVGRNLYGHGFTATQSLLDTLKIYKDAGLYTWMNKNENMTCGFCNVIHKHIESFKKDIKSGNTFSDWNRDFKEEFEDEIIDYEKSFNTYVWYAAYGSNINKSRFMRYINRCKDKTEPLDYKAYTIHHDIYFASESRIWEHKGVAFLDCSKSGMALGRIYKIKKTQFDEIFEMEVSKYNEIVKLGELDGTSVLTFTSSCVRKDKLYPSHKYIDVIKYGLKETYPNKSNFVLDVYLLSKVLETPELKVLQTLRNSAHGVTINAMREIGIENNLLNESIKKLYDLGLIRQDSRSINQSFSLTDNKSSVYTNSQMRDLIDIILLTRSM